MPSRWPHKSDGSAVCGSAAAIGHLRASPCLFAAEQGNYAALCDLRKHAAGRRQGAVAVANEKCSTCCFPAVPHIIAWKDNRQVKKKEVFLPSPCIHVTWSHLWYCQKKAKTGSGKRRGQGHKAREDKPLTLHLLCQIPRKASLPPRILAPVSVRDRTLQNNNNTTTTQQANRGWREGPFHHTHTHGLQCMRQSPAPAAFHPPFSLSSSSTWLMQYEYDPCTPPPSYFWWEAVPVVASHR